MASVSVAKAKGAGPGALLVACVAEHGSAAHPYFLSEALVSGAHSARNLADAVHFRPEVGASIVRAALDPATSPAR